MNNIALDYVHTLQKLILCIYIELDKMGDTGFIEQIGSTMLSNLEEIYKNTVKQRQELYKKVIALENKIKGLEKDKGLPKKDLDNALEMPFL